MEHSAEVHEENLGGDFFISVSPLNNSEGKLIGSVHAVIDVSERKWIEDLTRSQRDLAQSLSVATKLDEALAMCLETAIDVSGMDCGGVYLTEEETGDMNLVYSKGLSPAFVKAASNYDADSPYTRLIMKGKPVYKHYKKFLPSVKKSSALLNEGLKALAIVPVMYESKIVACLNIASHIHDSVSATASFALETIGAQIGETIVRIGAEEKLMLTMKQLQSLTSHLQNVREQERMQIARELHDELSSMLTVLNMGLVKIIDKLSMDKQDSRYEDLVKKARSMEGTINKSVELVRNIITRLRPGILDDLGLIPAIEWLIDECQGNFGIKCNMKSNLEQVELSSHESTDVFRIFQEILNNIVRHAKASRIDITMKKEKKYFIIEVIDNGCGIKQSDIKSKESFGIIGMRERANLHGWDFKISSKDVKGTKVTLKIKLGD